MDNKLNLVKEDGEVKKEQVFITFTQLYAMKQAKLEELINEHGAVYLLCKNSVPLRICKATLH